MEKFECQKSTWITHMGRQNYAKNTSRHCILSLTGGDFTGQYRFKKGFHGLSDIPTVFYEHIDKVLEFETPVWLDDIIWVTNGTPEYQERELREILFKLQKAGYRASEKKTDLFKKEITWLGYHINQNRVKPMKDKIETITKLEARKRTKSIRGLNPTSLIQIDKYSF